MGMERQTSIETEPMTLTINQLQFAREAALYVMNTKSMEEALSIFTEGLEPVRSVLKRNGDSMMNLGEEFDREAKYLPTSKSRDIVSAPF
ncbi:uncharacterized protein LOC117913116 [Vitis riparia]|uniref:uncharacterized protein LOC117913116 n=1 Tax=Vitis riparia TaxID=96939 RepID=UPI00155AAFAC|nr:uncharacterized protein LOC117913116 [Vitis riparia]